MSNKIASVTFAGASMFFSGFTAQSVFGSSEGVTSYFSGRRWATVFLYRQDIRAVHVNLSKDEDESKAALYVYDSNGTQFDVHLVDGEDADTVQAAICEWRMAASERWESESATKAKRKS